MKLRKRQWSDPNVQGLVDDLQLALDRIPDTEHRVVESRFTATMVLRANKRPVAIELIRAVFVNDEATPVEHGTAVNFVFRPTVGGCLVTRIDGLTPAINGPVYRFTFRITWQE